MGIADYYLHEAPKPRTPRRFASTVTVTYVSRVTFMINHCSINCLLFLCSCITWVLSIVSPKWLSIKTMAFPLPHFLRARPSYLCIPFLRPCSFAMPDVTYPLFPLCSLLGFFLVILPLPWHLKAWNTATAWFMIWTGLACLNQFVNSVVWHGNVINHAPIWCDICAYLPHFFPSITHLPN
jgi:hypothetical protein